MVEVTVVLVDSEASGIDLPFHPEKSALLIGASGAVGRELGPLLEAEGWHCEYRARNCPDSPNWQALDLGTNTCPPEQPVIFSLGPLDLFTAWLQRNSPNGARRVIALSSISVVTKRDSSRFEEQQVSARLANSERLLHEVALDNQIALTIVRPNMIWDGVHDQNVATLLRFARRWRFLPRPWTEGGLRNPIHAKDLAHFLSRMTTELPSTEIVSVGGPETLSCAEIFRRAGKAAGAIDLPVPSALLTIVGNLSRHYNEKIISLVGRWDRDQLAPSIPYLDDPRHPCVKLTRLGE